MRMRYGSRKAAILDAVRATQAAFGGVGSAVALVVVGFSLLALGWFGDAVYRMWFSALPAWASLFPFGVVMLVALAFSRVRPELKPEISEHLAAPARAMLLFLSPTELPEKDRTYSASDMPERDSWEMPLSAVRHHWQRGQLEWVYVIPSADTGQSRGTWVLLDRFRRLLADVSGVPQEHIINHPDHAHGVNFESAGELYRAVNQGLADLFSRGVRAEDIVIDVTGGQKMPAVLGGIAGLGEGLRIQYVSTHDKRPLEYNITMKVDR
ncbi:MAG: hypothetical protein Q9M29_09580 [Mariprofundaceae bacterium]|nr:hypothetical protein [Mariprofundaceae bacterium]